MADTQTPLVLIDPAKTPEENFLNLINSANGTDFNPREVTIGQVIQPDPTNDPTKTTVNVQALPRYGFKGNRDITYRRNSLAVLQNLVGYFKIPWDMTVTQFIQEIESRAKLAPRMVKLSEDTPDLTARQTVKVIPQDLNNLLYCGEMAISLQPPYDGTLLGPQSIAYGDQGAGFYGEVPGEKLITADNLLNAVNISTADLDSNYNDLTDPTIYQPNNSWLKFVYRDRILFVSKQILLKISFDTLETKKLIDGSTTIQIGNDTFKVRLIDGGGNANFSNNTTFGNVNYEPSEWSELIYPVSQGNRTEDGVTGIWAQYGDDELYVGPSSEQYPSIGSNRSWTLHTYGNPIIQALVRGDDDSSYGVDYGPMVYTSTLCGWRPVLELVQS